VVGWDAIAFSNIDSLPAQSALVLVFNHQKLTILGISSIPLNRIQGKQVPFNDEWMKEEASILRYNFQDHFPRYPHIVLEHIHNFYFGSHLWQLSAVSLERTTT
jgi:hypothetical protein